MNNGHGPDEVLEPNLDALRPVAKELQRWVDRLPLWSEASGEARQAFKRRTGKQELELAEKLRRIPGCTIARSSNGATITLTLAGVEVKAQGGLAAACRTWVAKMQRGEPGRSRTPN